MIALSKLNSSMIWLSKMESKDTDPADVALYEAAVKAQLEVLRTSEARYGAVQPEEGAR